MLRAYGLDTAIDMERRKKTKRRAKKRTRDRAEPCDSTDPDYVPPPSSGEDDEDSAPDEVHARTTWARSRTPELTQEYLQRIEEAVKSQYDLNSDSAPPGIYPFIHRCAREYAHLWDSRERLHCAREHLTKVAVSHTFNQVTPRHAAPFKGETDVAFPVVLTMLQIVFDMPGKGLTRGTPEWLAYKKTDAKLITYKDASEFPELESVLVKSLINNGIKKKGPQKGWPIIGDVLTPSADTEYQRTAIIVSNKRMVRPQTLLKFLRSGAHEVAVRRLRDGCFYPVKINAKTMPNNKSWTNIPQASLCTRLETTRVQFTM